MKQGNDQRLFQDVFVYVYGLHVWFLQILQSVKCNPALLAQGKYYDSLHENA